MPNDDNGLLCLKEYICITELSSECYQKAINSYLAHEVILMLAGLLQVILKSVYPCMYLCAIPVLSLVLLPKRIVPIRSIIPVKGKC